MARPDLIAKWLNYFEADPSTPNGISYPLGRHFGKNWFSMSSWDDRTDNVDDDNDDDD